MCRLHRREFEAVVGPRSVWRMSALFFSPKVSADYQSNQYLPIYKSMKQIIELLKSMKFWTIALTIIGILVGLISAWPKIEVWMTEEPVVSVGDYGKVDSGEPIYLSYILPIEHKANKAIVPLPIVISNENENALEKFFVAFQSKSKLVSGGKGWMQRLLPYDDYYANSKKENELLYYNNTNYNDGIQDVGNLNHGIDFPSKTSVRNLLVLNMAGEEGSEPWDEFTMSFQTGAVNCETKEYNFIVQCFFAESVDKKKAELINNNILNSNNIVITPSFSRIAINQDGLSIAIFGQ